MGVLIRALQALLSIILALFLVFALRELVLGPERGRAAMLAALCGGILFVRYRKHIPAVAQ